MTVVAATTRDELRREPQRGILGAKDRGVRCYWQVRPDPDGTDVLPAGVQEPPAVRGEATA